MFMRVERYAATSRPLVNVRLTNGPPDRHFDDSRSERGGRNARAHDDVTEHAVTRDQPQGQVTIRYEVDELEDRHHALTTLQPVEPGVSARGLVRPKLSIQS
jgi:hypothetical protein